MLTLEELYEKRGVLSRRVRNVRLADVQHTTVSQSPLGRLLSYGDVAVATAGTAGTELRFEHSPDPQAVVERITRELDDQ